MAETGTIGINVVVDGIAKATSDWDSFIAGIKKLKPTAADAAAALRDIEGAMKGFLAEGGKRSDEFFKSLQVAQKGLTQATKELTKAEADLAKQQKEITKKGDVGAIKQSIKAQQDLVAQYKQTYTTLAQVRAAIAQHNTILAATRTSTQANTTAGQDLIRTESAKIAALRQVESAYIAQGRASDEVARANERQNRSIAKLIQQGLLWATTSASFYYLYRRIVNVAQQLIKEVYGEAKAYKDATSALKQLGYALVIAAAEPQKVTAGLGTLADFLQHVTNRILQLSAAASGYRAAFATMTSSTGALSGALKLLSTVIGQANTGLVTVAAMKLGLLTEDEAALAAAVGTAQQQFEINNETMEATVGVSEEASRAIKDLTSIAHDFAEGQTEAAQGAADAWNDYQDALTEAQTDGAGAAADAASELAKKIEEINADALKRRIKAERDYQNRLADTIEQAERQRVYAARQHELDMKFMAQRYRLDRIQSERMYQYSRRQLVAEGDVLAIEDLDARYKLERKAAEENYNLQRKQAEAQYALQAEMLAQAMQDQIQELQEALAEQLAEIEENRKEQIEEARKAAAEQAAAGGGGARDAAEEAAKAYEEQKKALADSHYEMMQETAKSLAEFAKEHDLTAAQVIKVWEKATGKEAPSGLIVLTTFALNEMIKEEEAWSTAFEEVMSETGDKSGTALADKLELGGQKAGMALGKGLERELREVDRVFRDAGLRWTTVLQDMFRNMSWNVPSGGSTPAFGAGRYNPNYPGFQHGGEMIVSQPTMMQVGEHGVSERVVVQPLSPIGGHVGVSWQGGPIQMNGTGNFAGANMDAMAGVFNSMLRGFALEYVKQRGQLRGQKGR